jgi:hypothetical protein
MRAPVHEPVGDEPVRITVSIPPPAAVSRARGWMILAAIALFAILGIVAIARCGN